jgi:uncharacterized protein YhjY with autotransporter beta-barrel domain
MTTVRASALVGALMLAGTSQVFAQATPPPLTRFLQNSTTATQLQIDTGNAVQRTCTELGAEGGFQLEGAKGDLYLRCNEMVQTANQLNGNTATRSLNLNSDQLLGALQQVSGEELSSQGALTTRVTSGQFANISGRLNALRFGTQSAAARGRTASLTRESSPVVASYQPDRVVDPNAFRNDSLGGNLLKTSWSGSLYDDDSYGSGLRSSFLAAGDASGGGGGVERKFGWFTEGSYNFGDHDQTTSEDGFDFDSASGTIGFDYNFGNAVLGASAGYDRYKADFDSNAVVSGGNVEVKGGSGSVFGAWFGPHFSVDAIATYGSLSSDIERRLIIPSSGTCVPACPSQDRTFTGSPDGDYFSTGVSATYELEAASWNLGFSLAGTYRDVSIDGYAETDSLAGGGLALAYGDQTVKSFRSIVGFSASRSFSQGFGIVMPTFRAEWHHEFKDDPRVIQVQYALEPTFTNNSTCVSCFALQSDPATKDFGVVGAGLSFTFAQRLQAYVYYEALVGISDYKSNSVALGLRGQF